MRRDPADGVLGNAAWRLAVRERWNLLRECKSLKESEVLYASLVALMAQIPPHLRIAFGGTITPPYSGSAW